MFRFVVAGIAAIAALAIYVQFGSISASARVSKYVDPNLTLTADDLTLMKKAAREQLDGKPDGAVASWDNPKSGHSGTVTLLKSSTSAGQPCRRVRHSINAKGLSTPAHYVLNICKQADGSWKTKP